jgi:hypothetical protein
LAAEIARNASRMKYLAMAANCISSGSGLNESDQMNCVGYLFDTLEYIGGATADAADDLGRAVSEALEGAAQ